MNESFATVAFADLAGFTALTEAHGDRDAVGIVETFEQMTRQALAGQTRLVKLIGDAVMLAGPNATDVVRVLLDLARETDAMPNFPLLSAGAHEGSVVERDGDLFGTTVNIASRLASLADPGQVLVSRTIANRASADGIAVVRDVGVRSLRNVSTPVRVFELIRADADVIGWTIDPVCRMRVDPARRVVLIADEREVWFCSERCAARFSSHPDRFGATDDLRSPGSIASEPPPES